MLWISHRWNKLEHFLHVYTENAVSFIFGALVSIYFLTAKKSRNDVYWTGTGSLFHRWVCCVCHVNNTSITIISSITDCDNKCPPALKSSRKLRWNSCPSGTLNYKVRLQFFPNGIFCIPEVYVLFNLLDSAVIVRFVNWSKDKFTIRAFPNLKTTWNTLINIMFLEYCTKS